MMGDQGRQSLKVSGLCRGPVQRSRNRKRDRQVRELHIMFHTKTWNDSTINDNYLYTNQSTEFTTLYSSNHWGKSPTNCHSHSHLNRGCLIKHERQYHAETPLSPSHWLPLQLTKYANGNARMYRVNKDMIILLIYMNSNPCSKWEFNAIKTRPYFKSITIWE